MASTVPRRLAISDPHIPSTTSDGWRTDFLIASLSHGSTDIKLYNYDERANQTRLSAMLSDAAGGVGLGGSFVRSLAWSPAPSHATLLACGTASGQVLLHDLEPLKVSWPSSNVTRTGIRSGQTGTSVVAPNTKVGAMSLRHNRGCTSLVWSKIEPSHLFAGYDKIRNEPSLALWDVETAMSTPTTGVNHSKPEPIQTMLTSESITAVETLWHRQAILVSTGGRVIRLLDLRTNSNQAAITWQTKAAHGLAASEYLFAGYEDGLSGIVKVFDIRFPVSSGAATPLASHPGGGSGEVASYTAGGGSVIGVAWRPPREGVTRETLAIGLREAGVIALDVVSTPRPQSAASDAIHADPSELGDGLWSGFVYARKTTKPTSPLGDFTFLPSQITERTSLLSVFRDASYAIEHLEPSPTMSVDPFDDFASSQNFVPDPPSSVVDGTVDTGTGTSGAPGRQLRQIEDISPLRRIDPGATASDVGMLMRKKAELGFGLDLSRNDDIESAYPTNGGFLYLWLERFFNMMGRRSLCKIDDLDFTLQGLVSIWNGLDGQRGSEGRSKQTRRGFEAHPVRSQSQSSYASRGYRSTAHSSSRGQRDTVDPEYVSALLTVMEGREKEFVSTGIQVVTDRIQHRRLMLGICGELTEDRLDQEIDRIAQSQVTKAACLALFNGQNQRAIGILKDSADGSHHLMATLIRMGRIEADSIDLDDPYLRALVHFLQGNRAWDSVLRDESLPLLERLVLALRFVDDDVLPVFLERQMRSCIERGDLQGLPLTGLAKSNDCLDLLQRYLDRTHDFQTVAVISTLIYGRPDSRMKRWNSEYRKVLNHWRMFMERVDYDMARGAILRQQGFDVEIPARTIIRCNFCQKSISAEGPTSAHKTGQATRTDRCPNCQNTWPKCCVCLLPMNGPDKARLEDGLGGGSLVFCQTCHHGGHQSHILSWFYGPLEDESQPFSPRVASAAQETCPVADCGCQCASL